MRDEKGLAIGELSRRTGVNIETIRYFERVGIVATPPRTSGGRRVYGAGHVRVLGFIRGARELGFTPAEVRAILSLGGPRRRRAVRSARSRPTTWSGFARKWQT
ncbi:MerR family transcriptional regulator [Sphingobium sp. IP1]|uniref:MerR family transcriptional regulator n=1 Tax=Sphingobium sp. IP1 TaxID=2021637 RepID=UPI00211F23E1|nr:MerR family transcriptional regulator [Sphingobium sp. IP1]